MKAPRPKEHEKAIREAAVALILPEVLAWLGEDAGDEESVKKDLLKATGWCLDGYEISKDLDQIGWDPDAELVEIMDGFSFKVFEAHRNALKEWVIANNVTLSLRVGTIVTVPQKLAEKYPGTWTIARLEPETAQYAVAYPGGESNNGCYILNAEEVQPVPIV